MQNKLKVASLFCGCGGSDLGMVGGFDYLGKRYEELPFEIAYAVDFDHWAVETYNKNFKHKAVCADVTEVDFSKISDIDVMIGGFPCQSFSTVNPTKDTNDARANLYKQIVRFLQTKHPKYFICENVKGLVMHDKGRTFQVIRQAFRDIGYQVYWKVLNSKDFGVPQNRERIYIVAFRDDLNIGEFVFPKGSHSNVCIRDILEEAPIKSKYYLSDVYVETLRAHKARHASKGNGFGYEIRDLSGIAGTIVCGGMGRERNLIIDHREHSMIPETHIKGKINDEDIRKMTPREWARLQGFPDTFKLELADTHLYKQFGNSVSVNVIEAIAKNIKETLK